MEAILQLEHVRKEYKGFVLDDISFQVPRGMIVGLIGENGAGKTTTISAILNMIEKDRGSIRVFGRDHEKYEREIKQKIGVVCDGLAPYGKYFVKDIEKIMKGIYKAWDSAKYQEYIRRFELPPDKRVKDLSKGMTMKLNFAAALSHGAELLILDEATSGLDPIMRAEILEVLQEFVMDERHSVLLSTHITSDLDRIADYIVFIHKGRCAFMKSKEELDNDYGIINCGHDLFEALPEENVVSYIKEEMGYRVLVCGKGELVSSFRDLAVDKAAVEDIMYFFVKGEEK